MLLYMYENNIIIYALFVLLGVGVLIKIIEGLAYRQLIKASKEMGVSENKLMKQIRLRVDTCYRIKLGVHNVDSFVDKSVYSYKFCGISLYTLENLSGQVTILGLLITIFASILAYFLECGQDIILYTLTIGAGTVLLLIAFDMLLSLPAKQKILRIHMKDYLENNLKAKLENEYFLPEEMQAYRQSYFEKNAVGEKAEAKKEVFDSKADGKKIENSSKNDEDDKIIEEILREYLV